MARVASPNVVLMLVSPEENLPTPNGEPPRGGAIGWKRPRAEPVGEKQELGGRRRPNEICLWRLRASRGLRRILKDIKREALPQYLVTCRGYRNLEEIKTCFAVSCCLG